MVQVLEFEQQYLEAIPSAQMYERSYMHRDTVTHVVVGRWVDQSAWAQQRAPLCCSHAFRGGVSMEAFACMRCSLGRHVMRHGVGCENAHAWTGARR